MNLAEMLEKRQLPDLLQTAHDNKISFEGILTEEEEDTVFHQSGHQWNELVAHYYDYYLEEPEDFAEMENSDPQEWQSIILRSVRKCAESKAEIASRAAEILLQEEMAEGCLVRWGNTMYELLDMVKREEGTQTVCLRDLPLNMTLSADRFSQKGYGMAAFTDPYHNEDGRRHCVSLELSRDVLDLFSRVCTTEFIARQNICEAVYTACCIVKCCYGIAPLETAMKLYSIYSEGKLPELSEEEFIDMAVETGEYLFKVRKKDGLYYIVDDITGGEAVEMDEDELEYFAWNLDRMGKNGNDFYLPDRAEMKEFITEGYWPSRSGYRQLREFLQEYYLEDQKIERIGRNFYLALTGEEEDRVSEYDLDRVDEETEEIIFEVVNRFMCGNSPEDAETSLQRIFDNLNDESRPRLREILALCARQTNSFNDMGYAGRNVTAAAEEQNH